MFLTLVQEPGVFMSCEIIFVQALGQELMSVFLLYHSDLQPCLRVKVKQIEVIEDYPRFSVEASHDKHYATESGPRMVHSFDRRRAFCFDFEPVSGVLIKSGVPNP